MSGIGKKYYGPQGPFNPQLVDPIFKLLESRVLCPFPDDRGGGWEEVCFLNEEREVSMSLTQGTVFYPASAHLLLCDLGQVTAFQSFCLPVCQIHWWVMESQLVGFEGPSPGPTGTHWDQFLRGQGWSHSFPPGALWTGPEYP